MSGTKRNVFVVFVFTEMTILIGLLGIQGSRPVTSSTSEMDVTTEVNGSFTVHACEHNESTISCKENERIHIEYANFGRLSGDICGHWWYNNLNCAANDSLSIVRRLCSGKPNCTVPASTSILGDPCPRTSKYLKVTYQCLPVTKIKRPCRNNNARSGAVNLSESVSKDTLQLEDKLENLTENFSLILVHELMDDVESVSTGDELCGGDFATLGMVLVGVINLTESIRTMNFSDAYRINKVVVNTTSMLLQPNNMETWKELPKTNQSSTATRLLWCVESSLAILAKSINETHVFKSSAPGLNVLAEVSGKKSFSTPLNWVSSYDKVDNLTFIMPEGVNDLGRVTVALFDDVAQWLHVNDSATNSSVRNSSSAAVNDSLSDATPEVIVITRVMSISIVSRSGKDAVLKGKVRYTLEHKEKKSNYSKPKCVYWKYSKGTFEGYWSDEGCQEVSNCSDCNYTICECNHLTNFAVLMSVSGAKMSTKHAVVLSVITYIGCIISIVCLALAFITFYWFKGLQCDRNTIHKNLVFCLFIAEVIFLLGIGQHEHKMLCAVVAGILHYFFLASFSWMFLEGVQLYILLVEVFEAEKSRLKWYYLSAYGAPTLIVFISALATYGQKKPYTAEINCWLSTKGGLIWAFTGPVAVIIFMNSVMLGLAIHTMCKHSSTASSLKKQHKSKIDTIGSFVRGAVALMILLGSTWTAGFLYVNEESLFMAYIFTILNSLQGLFIFIFHCLTNEKVRKEYRRCIQRCTCLPEDVRIKYGGLSGSAALSMTPNQSNSSGVSTLFQMLKNRKRNQSITSSSLHNSSSEKGSSSSTTSHKIRRHGSSTSECALLTDSSGISSRD